MLVGGITLLSLLLSGLLCGLTGSFESLNWLWVLPCGFVGSFVVLAALAFLLLLFLCAIVDQKKPQEESSKFYRAMLHLYVDYSFDFNEIKHSDTVYRAMEYIRSNFSRKITLEEIASYVHLSGSHLSGTFHKETGQTISAYINHVRIEKSKQLLAATQATIAEVAALCGYEDQSYFSRVFRQGTGLSPKRFREVNQNQ